LCCATFLGDFEPVSIKMAKEQNLSLNPTKISGICGRLMCCLKYEEEVYEQIRKGVPAVGTRIMTPRGEAIVVDICLFKQTLKVRLTDGDGELVEYSLAEIKVLPGQE
jgi:cell fate regulator YaaT (PSP1 superfamily)